MHRNQAGSDWVSKAVIFSVATTGGGVALGVLFGAIGSLLPLHARIAIASVAGVVAVAIGALEVANKAVPVIQCNRETPQQWVHLGPLRWAARNGLALGCGATTRVGFWSWYSIPIAALLVGQIDIAAVICGVYGLVRGLCAWGFILADAVLSSRLRLTFDDLAVWVLTRRPTAKLLGAAHLIVVGSAVAIAAGL